MTKQERNKIYRKTHKDEIAASNKAYRNNNKEKLTQINKEYRANNKQHIKLLNKNYYENNKEKIKTEQKLYYEKNKDKRNDRQKTRRKTDYLFKLKQRLRCSIGSLLRERGFRKKCKTIDILGCSFEQFKLYIESKFELWMNWNNYGLYNGESNYGWDIDHKIPVSSGSTEDEIIKLNHYTNLQPLCSHINRNVKIANY